MVCSENFFKKLAKFRSKRNLTSLNVELGLTFKEQRDNPEKISALRHFLYWIPAFAGMTMNHVTYGVIGADYSETVNIYSFNDTPIVCNYFVYTLSR